MQITSNPGIVPPWLQAAAGPGMRNDGVVPPWLFGAAPLAPTVAIPEHTAHTPGHPHSPTTRPGGTATALTGANALQAVRIP